MVSNTTNVTNTQSKTFYLKQHLTCSKFGILRRTVSPVFQFLRWPNKAHEVSVVLTHQIHDRKVSSLMLTRG